MQPLAGPIKPADLECARAMLDGLPSVMWFIRRQMRSHRARGLSVPQFRTLAQLDRFGKSSLSCVADNLGCTLPTASRMLTNMVRTRLVKRCACSEDRRQIWLTLTPKGRAALHDTRAKTARQLANKIAHLPASEKTQISRTMQALCRIFDVEVAAALSADHADPSPAAPAPARKRRTAASNPAKA